MLFEPLTIRGIVLRNRLAVSPMCQYSSQDGFANEWHLVHLGSRATGGASLVIAEATAVSPEGRITPGDLGIWKDDHIAYLSTITSFIKSQGAVPGIQLAHAGRKASHALPWEGAAPLSPGEGAWPTVGPSTIPYKEGVPVPQALDEEGINKVKDDFLAATHRALKAGFQVIEIHAAHGYLLHEFLSPLSNRRTDAYGGSFENRIRLLLEVTESIRSALPQDLPLFVRISATDWVEGGWTPDDSVALAKELKNRGVDLIDCSSGGNVSARITVGPLYQVPFARKVKQEGGIMSGAVGLITTPQEAEDILTRGDADLILLARQFLRDPYFPLHAAQELGQDIPWPVQYDRAKGRRA